MATTELTKKDKDQIKKMIRAGITDAHIRAKFKLTYNQLASYKSVVTRENKKNGDDNNNIPVINVELPLGDILGDRKNVRVVLHITR